MNRNILSILVLIAVALGGWFIGARFGPVWSGDDLAPVPLTNKTVGKPDKAATPVRLPETVQAQGRLRPAGGLLRIVASPGERVSSLTSKKIGDQVEADEVLATLSSRSLREKDLKLAEARREDAMAQLEFEQSQASYKLKSAELAVAEANAAEQKISEQVATIDLLRSQLVAAQRLRERLQNLFDNATTRSLVNQTDLEKQQLLVEQLELQIQQAEQSRESATNSAGRAKQSAQNNLDNVKFAIANAADGIPLKSLDAAVALARKAFEMSQVRAPAAATIVDITVQEGDSVTNQPIMVLADLSQMNCEVEVVDAFLKRIDIEAHPELRAKITHTALPEPLFGRVIAKGLMVGSVSLPSPNPFEKVDQRTGIVTVKLDRPEMAAQFINLQVTVEIETKPGTF